MITFFLNNNKYNYIDYNGPGIIKHGLVYNIDPKNIDNYEENKIIDSVNGLTISNNINIDSNRISKYGLICDNNYILTLNSVSSLIKDFSELTVELIQSKYSSDMLFLNKNNLFFFNYLNVDNNSTRISKYEHNCITKNNKQTSTSKLINDDNYVHLQFVFKSNGTAQIWINGYKGYEDIYINDLQNYSKLFDYHSSSQLKYNDALNYNGDTIFIGLRIYNRALSVSELEKNFTVELSNSYISSFKIFPKNITIKKKSELTLFNKINPYIIPDKYQTNLYSDSQNILIVDKNRIKATNVGVGSITLQCEYKDDIIQDTINYEVVESLNLELPTLQREPYTGIVIGNKIESLYVDEEYALMAFLTPYMPTYDNIIKFASDNPDICAVNYGVLKAVSVGECTITATDPEGFYSDSFIIKILEKPIENIDESEVYYVDVENYGISIDNTNGVDTTKGIINALEYASTNGYKKTVFPKGTYLTSIYANKVIDDTIYTTGTIKIPSNMIVDFSNSTINIEPVNSSTIKYSMFAFQGNCKNSKIINATIYGERETMTLSPSKSDEHSLCVLFYDAENCGLENCTVGKSNGFNIQGLRGIRGSQFNFASILQENIEAGSYNDNGDKDDINIDNNWRTINKVDVTKLGDHFELGHVKYYSGYLISARLYDIIFYDENETCIDVQRNCIQFFRYNTPAGAKYANLVFHQKTQPSGVAEGDFNYMVSLYTLGEPYKCYIRNCIIRDNYSTGIAMCGGKRWLMENNRFINNNGRDPSCHVDYEDGWDSMVGDIWRYNTFERDGGGFLNVDGHSIVIHNNIFNITGFDQRIRCQNYRIYNNVFNNCNIIKLESQSESTFSENLLYKTTVKIGNYYHANNLYSIRIFNNYTIE